MKKSIIQLISQTENIIWFLSPSRIKIHPNMANYGLMEVPFYLHAPRLPAHAWNMEPTKSTI